MMEGKGEEGQEREERGGDGREREPPPCVGMGPPEWLIRPWRKNCSSKNLDFGNV